MLVQLQALGARAEGDILFEGVNASVHDRQRIGIVGRNGAGKSTLLSMMMGDRDPDLGGIIRHPTARVGVVRQYMGSTDRSILDVALQADADRTRWMQELENSDDPDKMTAALEGLDRIDGFMAEVRVAMVLEGLGFPSHSHNNPIGSYSGGWQMRVALAGALSMQPDILYLDEPSNHLDLEARVWLADYLADYPHSVVMVTHDTELLNRVVQQIWWIEHRGLTVYRGNFDRAERLRSERRLQGMRLQERQAAERAKMQAFVDRFRAKASKAKQAQSRLKMMEGMVPVIVPPEDQEVMFLFPQADPLPSPLVAIDEGVIGYGSDSPILSNLLLRIDWGDRIAILGPNGYGKSTLLRSIAGDLALLSGMRRASGKLRIGYIAQHHAETLPMDLTAYQMLVDLLPYKTEAQRRAILGQFGLTKRHADSLLGHLSGGERLRFALCLGTLNAPHLLILDEPTNHMDHLARRALIEALQGLDCAIILVSHDQDVLESVVDQLWVIDRGRCEPWDGDLEDYRNHIMALRHASPKGGKKQTASTGTVAAGTVMTTATTASASEAPKRRNGSSSKHREQVARLERAMDGLRGKIAALEASMVEMAATSPTNLGSMATELSALMQQLEDTEKAWLDHQEG